MEEFLEFSSDTRTATNGYVDGAIIHWNLKIYNILQRKTQVQHSTLADDIHFSTSTFNQESSINLKGDLVASRRGYN